MAAWFNIVSPGQLGLLSHSRSKISLLAADPWSLCPTGNQCTSSWTHCLQESHVLMCVFGQLHSLLLSLDYGFGLNSHFSVPNYRFSHLLGIKWQRGSWASGCLRVLPAQRKKQSIVSIQCSPLARLYLDALPHSELPVDKRLTLQAARSVRKLARESACVIVSWSCVFSWVGLQNSQRRRQNRQMNCDPCSVPWGSRDCHSNSGFS